MERALGIILLLAYAARVIGACFHDPESGTDPARPPRSKAREIVDAIAWPMTMFASKAKRGMELSALRVLVISTAYMVDTNIDWTSEWNGWKVAAILGPPGLLILEPLFGLIPVKEMLMAGAAYFGAQVSKRVTKSSSSSSSEETTGTAPEPTTESAPRVPGAE